jgi:hypothetical protein
MDRTDVTELIPKALGNYWLIFFGGAAVVAALEFAYCQLPTWSQTLGEKSLVPLDVTSSGSIMAWCLSTLFLLSAGVSLLNSRLGKKYDGPDKSDVWFWTTFAMILLSLDTQVQFRETIRSLLVYASGTPLHQNGDVWWMAVYSFVFGLIAIRLLQDLWAYPPAFLVFSLSILGAVTSLLIQVDVISVSATVENVVVLRTAIEAMAVLLLFLSFLLFGRRQVFRDPQVAMLWFAKVWKQNPQTKKPTPTTPGAATNATMPPPTTEAAVKPCLTGPRPLLDKKDDDFTLLKAS